MPVVGPYVPGMRFLFVMDPAETMTPDKDTTFAFLRGARALGHQSYHCLPSQVSLRGADGFAVARPIAVSDTAPHVELGAPERARPALERAARLAIDAQAVRAALATLYRDLADHAALATLLADEAGRTSDRRQRIQLLRDAAEIQLVHRNDPALAAPLLEQAIELDPDDQKLRLRLAQALFLAARYPDALGVLREQIQRYGARKPKDRALAHFQLARVLLASGEEGEALRELDAASKIDPAHPGIMQMLGRVAMEQGEFDRAERMFRSLMLVVGRDEDPEAPSKTEALLSLSELSIRRGDEARPHEVGFVAVVARIEGP